MGKLHELHDNGQSVWLDFIRREMLGPDGELAALVSDGIRGVTSNPSIFQKAISTSAAYDGQIQSVLTMDGEASTQAVFEELAIRDIQGAADILRGVYDESGGTDGFVSLEVAPSLAYDADGTIADARRLWRLVNRPNLMIKVPATAEGIPAVEQLIADGLNINITLMFSLDDYENVAQAYLRGLRRAEDPSGIASVASFFVSRVDTKADDALEKVGSDEAMALRGRIAVANAKLTYRRYQELFEGDGFSDLAARGASPQRVLWASTSTKNPEYKDTLYVDELVGPNTVNTMPPATIEAFVEHGVIDPGALTDDVDGAFREIAALADLGIDFDGITATLQTEGVRAFADSMDELYTTLGEKIAAIRS
ncbi:MAG TPA: transaldolase [Acidimicrobiia bacterium]|jgi:transaldolase|nr:transaldolase [Acidimicrobiia bacterium]